MKSTTNQGTLADYKAGHDTFKSKIFTFQLTHINTKSNLQKQFDEKTGQGVPVYFPPLVTIPNSDLVIDALGNRREIRYVPGLRTIFVDEMTAEERSDKKNYAIKFVDGRKMVEGYDKNLVEFMFLTNWNSLNPKKTVEKPHPFFLVDKEAFFRDQIDKDAILETARHWCNTAPSSEILQYALPLLGAASLINRDVNEIRYNLKNLAAQNPQKFLDDRDSPSMKRKGTVIQAVSREVLSSNPGSGQVAWANNLANPLSTAPIGVDPIDHFVAATFTPDGERIFAEVVKQLQPKVRAEMNPVATPVEKKPLLEVPSMDKEAAGDLYQKLLDLNVIKMSGAWVRFGPNVKWTGRGAFERAVISDSKLLAKLKEKQEKAEYLAKMDAPVK